MSLVLNFFILLSIYLKLCTDRQKFESNTTATTAAAAASTDTTATTSTSLTTEIINQKDNAPATVVHNDRKRRQLHLQNKVSAIEY